MAYLPFINLCTSACCAGCRAKCSQFLKANQFGTRNSILDIPEIHDDDEWDAAILCRIKIFEELARVSSKKHSHLDGGGWNWASMPYRQNAANI